MSRSRRSFFPMLPSAAAAAAASSKASLPVSRSPEEEAVVAAGGGGGLRRRLSSMSLNLKKTPFSSSSSSSSSVYESLSSWSFPRSKSLSSMGDYAREWWAWSWAWILSRKPIFAVDLEMNEQETKLLGGSHHRGSWRHVFYRMRSEIRRIFISTTHSDYAPLPQTYRPPQEVQQY